MRIDFNNFEKSIVQLSKIKHTTSEEIHSWYGWSEEKF